MPIPTPHIDARFKEDIAPTVIMPGDPLRARFIAENYLSHVKQYNATRGMFGFTGIYRSAKVSVQGSGMGMPSMGLYAYELFRFYDVQNIIRIGTAGAIDPVLKVRDIIFAVSASTDSNFGHQYNLPGIYVPTADFGLLRSAVKIADEAHINYKAGNVLSSDVFYGDDPEALRSWRKLGVLAVEMECAALYMNAARADKKALGILTVSDTSEEITSAKEREKSFTDMIKIALELSLKIS